MSWKDLLVVLDPAADTPTRLALAATLAERFAAHLVGLYPMPPSEPARPVLVPDLVGLGPFFHEWRERALAEAERVRQSFEHVTELHGLSREWRMVDEGREADPAVHARYADLAILGQRDPDDEAMAMYRPSPERVTLATGRPILVVPYAGEFTTVGRSVLVAWNAGREAARAVADAMPLLTGAERVDILIVDPQAGPDGHGEVPGADIALHLARHGVEAQIENTQSAGVPIGELILSRAADLGSDLLVMGAYGHSRARELLLGGATRSILASMTIPVLMAH
ncbi:MAG: universal stress protein [Stellaceae bacterium]